MRLPPNSDLNTMTSHTAILKEAGVIVKGISPEVCQCPLCGETMSIVLDPFSTGTGRWLWCISCKFYGDALELLKQLRNEQSMQDTLRRAEAFGHITGQGGFISQDAVEHYINGYHKERIKRQLIWKGLQANNLNRLSDSDVTECIQQHKLWASYNSIGSKALRLFGCARKSEIKAIFQEKVLPKSGFSTSLIFNFQDVPGRTCAFHYYHDKMRFVQVFPEPIMERPEAGIAFLDTLCAKENVVFALTDPLLVVRMYQKRLTETGGEFKVIAYHQDTRVAWGSVHANKVVFYPSKIDWNVFQHAKTVQNSHVSISNCKLGGRSVSSFLRNIEQDALPWKSAFANWILDEGRTESEIMEAVVKLSLTPRERNEILETVPEKLRERLNSRLGEQVLTKSIAVNRRLVVEKAGGWYTNSLKGEELLCDAPFTVDKILIDVKTQKIHWIGVIRHAGANISYVAPYEDIERGPADWLVRTVVKTGVGAPIVQHYISKDLPGIARQFSEPKTITIDRKLGLDEATGQIWFPKFSLEDGEFKPTPIPAETEDPAGRLQIPKPDQAFTFADSLVFEREPMLAAYIAAASAITAGLLSPLGGWRRKPIGIIGSRTGGAAQLCKRLTSNFDIRHMQLNFNSRRDIEYILQRAADDNWYVFVDTVTSGQLSCWPADCGQPIIAVLTPLEAAVMALTSKWTLIHAENVINDVVVPSSAAMLMHLSDLQRREYGIPSSDLHKSLITDFSRWWATGLNHDVDALTKSALLQVVEPQAAGAAFVELCCRLRRQGKIYIQYSSFVDPITGTVNTAVIEGQKKASIVFDEAAGRVYVSREKLLKSMARAELPIYNMEDVERDLIDSNSLVKQSRFIDGWVISASYWAAAEKNFLTKCT